MIGVWRKLLNERKQAYWNAIRCENLADTYEKWRQKEQVILPRKYRLKQINKEPDEETKIRMNLAVQKLDAEITLLRVRVPKYKIKFENCDKQIFEEISRRTSEEMTSNLQDLWNKEVEIDANKSEEILKSKQKWLDDYEKNYGNDWMKIPHNRKPKLRKNRKQLINQRGTFTERINPPAEHQSRQTYADVTRTREEDSYLTNQRKENVQPKQDFRTNRNYRETRQNGNIDNQQPPVNRTDSRYSHGKQNRQEPNPYFLWRATFHKTRRKPINFRSF